MIIFLNARGISALVLALAFEIAKGNRFQEAFVMNCDHTFPDGTTYDLTPLTRYLGDLYTEMFISKTCSQDGRPARLCWQR